MSFERHYFDKELCRILPEWKKTGLLDGLDDYKAEQLAIILENQKLFKDCSSSNSYNKLFIDNSIEIAAKIYKDFLGFELISVQSMLGPADLIYYSKIESHFEEDTFIVEKNVVNEEVAAKTRKLKAVFTDENQIEAYTVEVQEEITREIFNDLRQNCSSVLNVSLEDLQAEKIFSHIHYLSGAISRKCLTEGQDWIVTNPKIARILSSHMGRDVINMLEELEKSDSKRTIITIGHLGMRWKLIVDKIFPENKLLMGRYKHFDAGYFYCPYVMAGPVELLDNSGFHSNGRGFIRYGKKMTRQGSKYYGVINFKELEQNE